MVYHLQRQSHFEVVLWCPSHSSMIISGVQEMPHECRSGYMEFICKILVSFI
jgi:D-hexose-6-phosphate mutarotase